MTDSAASNGQPGSERVRSMGWKELWLKEDWWAIWLGLGIVIVAYLFFANGSSIKWIAISPAKWSNFDELATHFTDHILQYLAQFALWCVIFGISLRVLGFKLDEFYPSFVFIYVCSILIAMLGAWDQAHKAEQDTGFVA